MTTIEMKKRAFEFYKTVSINTILNASMSKKAKDTVVLKVQSPEQNFTGYIWIEFDFINNCMSLCSKYVRHTVRNIY